VTGDSGILNFWELQMLIFKNKIKTPSSCAEKMRASIARDSGAH